MKALKMYLPHCLIFPIKRFKLPTMYPPIDFTFLERVLTYLSIVRNLRMKSVIGFSIIVFRIGPSFREIWCMKLIMSVKELISFGTIIAVEIKSNKYGIMVELVFYIESNKVGDYSQILLINLIVSMKNESLYENLLSTYFFINYSILTKIKLSELYLAM